MKINKLEFSESSVHFSVDGREWSTGEILKIDVNNLVEELQNQPGKFSWWSLLCAQSASEMRTAEKNLRSYEDEQLVKVKKTYREMGLEIPEYYARALVRTQSGYLAGERIFLERKREFEILDSIRSALWQRKNMLESLATNARMEYFSHVRT